MSTAITLAASARARAGKGAARAARREGLVPAVIYGGKQPPVPMAVEERALRKQLSMPGFRTRLIDLTVDGTKHHVLCREVQFHPVTDRPIHADFLRVTDDTVVHVNVTVHFLNELASPGLKRGGVLNVVRHTVELFCKARAIPTHLEVDLTGRDINDSIHISAIALPEGVKPVIQDRDFTVATIIPPTVGGDAAIAAAEAEKAAAAPKAGAAPTKAAAPAAAAKAAPAKK